MNYNTISTKINLCQHLNAWKNCEINKWCYILIIVIPKPEPDILRSFEKRSWSLSLRLVYPVLHIPPGATITSSISPVRNPNSDYFLTDGGTTYLLWEIEPIHFSAEGLRPWDWSYPVWQYLREWPTPTVIIFDTWHCRYTPTSTHPRNRTCKVFHVTRFSVLWYAYMSQWRT